MMAYNDDVTYQTVCYYNSALMAFCCFAVIPPVIMSYLEKGAFLKVSFLSY